MTEVWRIAQKQDSTLSVLFIDGVPASLILEDKLRKEKIKGETAIPEGEYQLAFNTEGGMNARYFNHKNEAIRKMHKGMIEITGINDFKFVYFHIGSFIKNTLGCNLTGYDLNIDENNNIALYKSTLAYIDIYPRLVKKIESGDNKILFRNAPYLTIF